MMSVRYTRSIASKWKKTLALLRQKELRPYIPLTKKFTKASFSNMVRQCNMVYLKPDEGTSGEGVMKIETVHNNGSNQYRYQTKGQTRSFTSLGQLYNDIRKSIAGKPYLVQQGIPMITHHNRPFDIRVMVQQNPQGKWETTGIAGRIARQNRIVTNISNGGSVLHFDHLLASYTGENESSALKRKLSLMGVRVASHLSREYSGIKELGIDVALDAELKPWILEVNTQPVVILFARLKDKRMINKICRYGKAYGRSFRDLASRGLLP